MYLRRGFGCFTLFMTDASWPLELGGKLETGAKMADYFTKRHTPHCCTSMIRDTGGGTQQIP